MARVHRTFAIGESLIGESLIGEIREPPSDPNVEEYWFVCQKWFDKHIGDEQTIRELLPTDEQGNILGN